MGKNKDGMMVGTAYETGNLKIVDTIIISSLVGLSNPRVVYIEYWKTQFVVL